MKGRLGLLGRCGHAPLHQTGQTAPPPPHSPRRAQGWRRTASILPAALLSVSFHSRGAEDGTHDLRTGLSISRAHLQGLGHLGRDPTHKRQAVAPQRVGRLGCRTGGRATLSWYRSMHSSAAARVWYVRKAQPVDARHTSAMMLGSCTLQPRDALGPYRDVHPWFDYE